MEPLTEDWLAFFPASKYFFGKSTDIEKIISLKIKKPPAEHILLDIIYSRFIEPMIAAIIGNSHTPQISVVYTFIAVEFLIRAN